MRIKKAELKFNILVWDINTNKLVPRNIFSGVGPYKFGKDAPVIRTWAECINIGMKRRDIKSRLTLRSWLHDQLMYEFDGRAEYEMIVGPWPYHTDESFFKEAIKVSAWQQIEPNLDLITDMVIREMRLPYN